MATFILIPGGWQGGWVYEKVAAGLTAHGHKALPIGAADADPSRIQALVYVDAYVPDSGDSVWSLTTPRFRDLFVAGAKADGLTCAPRFGVGPATKYTETEGRASIPPCTGDGSSGSLCPLLRDSLDSGRNL
jgi:hypothetical protein